MGNSSEEMATEAPVIKPLSKPLIQIFKINNLQTQKTTKLQTENVQTHTLNSDSVGRNNIIFAQVVSKGFRSNKFRLLLDTGASYSVLSLQFLKKLQQEGLSTNIILTKRKTPSSASNHQMETMGDVILNLRFGCHDGELEIRNIRFTILRSLSTEMILGIEALVSLDLRVTSSNVTILNRRIPLCPQTIQMEIIDAYTYDDGVTVAHLRPVPGTATVNSMTNYILSPILPEYDQHVLSGSPDSVRFDTCLVKGRELEAVIDYHFYTPMFDLPAILEFKLEEVEDKQKWRPKINSVMKSLQNRTKFIDDNVINQMLEDSDLAGRHHKELKRLLESERSVFAASEFDVGSYTEEEIDLDLIDPTPVYVKPRRVPYTLRDVLHHSIKEMCDKGIIEKTKGSNYNSPVHLVKKVNSDKWRFCTDFRQVNAKLKMNHFPLPRIQDLLEKLQGSQFLSSIDLKHGFFNVNLTRRSREYTAFSVDGQQYQYRKLPMGLNVSPQVFQRVMMDILADYLDKGMVVYLDDVLLYSKDEQSHLVLLRKLFLRLSKAGILLNPAKCKFGKCQLDYLGFTISRDGYRAQKCKLETIKNFVRPTTKKSLKRFLGMASFYSTLVPDLQYIMGPLHSITGSASKYNWENEQEEAFELTKERLVNSATLAFPSQDPKAQLVLSTDASAIGWGAALSEIGADGIERAIGFTSGRFRSSAERWIISEKEAYAFVQALNFFYVYLYGHHFTWRTDNRSISFLKTTSFTRKPSGIVNYKTLRWLEFIAQFNFSIEHHAGTAACMAAPDCLSRQFEEAAPLIHQLSEVTVKEPFWVKHQMCMADYIIHQDKDENLKGNKGGWKNFIKMKWKPITQNELIYYQTPKGDVKLAVPDALQLQLMEFTHLPLHTSHVNMIAAIRGKYCFPYLVQKVSRYIKGCELCVAVKTKKKAPTSSVATSQPHHPWESLAIDLIGPLSKTLNGNVYILSCIDMFTRYCELKPLKDRQAVTVAEKMLEIFYIRGPCLNITMDNARELQSDFMKSFLKDLGIYSQPICPYRPQSNGMVESLNKRVKMKLQLLEVEPLYWDRSLPAIQLAINLEKLQQFGTSPFQLLHGWLLQPTSFVDVESKKHNTMLTDPSTWSKTFRVHMAHALANHFKMDKGVKRRRAGDNQDPPSTILNPGTKVLRYFIQPPGECGKLFRNWKGTFEILERVDRHTYIVAREDDHRKKYIVHRDNLRPICAAQEELHDDEVVQKEQAAAEHGPPSEQPTRPKGQRPMEMDEPSQEVDVVRRSLRLKNKSTNFKKYFYDEPQVLQKIIEENPI